MSALHHMFHQFLHQQAVWADSSTHSPTDLLPHLPLLGFTAHTRLAVSTAVSAHQAPMELQRAAQAALALASCLRMAQATVLNPRASPTRLPTSMPIQHLTRSPSPCLRRCLTRTSPLRLRSTLADNSLSTMAARPLETLASLAGTCRLWTVGQIPHQQTRGPQLAMAQPPHQQRTLVLPLAGLPLTTNTTNHMPRWTRESHLSGRANGDPFHQLKEKPVLAP